MATMKVWCPARGQTEADAVEVEASTAIRAVESVAESWIESGDPFEGATFLVDAGFGVMEVEFVVLRRPKIRFVRSGLRKEQG